MPWVGRPKSSNRAADNAPKCNAKAAEKVRSAAEPLTFEGGVGSLLPATPPDQSERQPVRDREYPRELLAESTQPCAGGKHDVLTGAATHDVCAYQAPESGHRR